MDGPPTLDSVGCWPLTRGNFILPQAFFLLQRALGFIVVVRSYVDAHGLRTPNEGINQRYLKNWAEVADKICFGRT